MQKDGVDRWLEAYIAAWQSYDRDQIRALFSEDVEYRYHPYDQDPVRGADAVAASWLGEGDYSAASSRDAEGTNEAAYRTVAVDGDAAVATGTSSYRETPGGPIARVYENCYVMRFDEAGRCVSSPSGTCSGPPAEEG